MCLWSPVRHGVITRVASSDICMRRYLKYFCDADDDAERHREALEAERRAAAEEAEARRAAEQKERNEVGPFTPSSQADVHSRAYSDGSTKVELFHFTCNVYAVHDAIDLIRTHIAYFV